MANYEYGPDVAFHYEPIRGGPAFAEVLVNLACPTCGADWSQPGSVRLGYQVGREVLCWACMTFHRAARQPLT